MIIPIVLLVSAIVLMYFNIPKHSFRSEKAYKRYKRKTVWFQISLLMLVTALVMFAIAYTHKS